jgi:penicillin-binding protein 1A
MKSSNRWAVMKDLDKATMKSLLHSAKSKKWRSLLGRWKRYHNDSYRFNSLLQILLQSGLMAMEPQTGNIKAWVGGINYKYFQYDHVGQEQESRFYIQAICLRYCNRAVKHVSLRLDHWCAIYNARGRHHATEAWSPRTLTTSTAEW